MASEQLWTHKYRPKDTNEVVSQEGPVKQLRAFVQDYRTCRKKAALVYGPTGTGKTSAIHALAQELNYDILEINASHVRNKDAMQSIIGNATKQMSLFSKGKIILIDEVDGISGTADRGGIPMLVSLIRDSSFPIILTARDLWNEKFKELRKEAVPIEFSALDTGSVALALKRICESEGICHDDESLHCLARRAGSDLRGAINDLQILTIADKKLVKGECDELSERNRTDTIINALLRIFKTTDASVALGALEGVQELIDESMLWLDENIPKEYTKPADLARAYDALSMADVYNGRIRRQQYWRLLTYVSAHLTLGVASAKDEKYRSYVRYGPTMRLLRIWRGKMRQSKRNSIAQKLKEKTHVSTRRAIKSTLPYLKNIFRNNPGQAEKISLELGLDADEAEWMGK